MNKACKWTWIGAALFVFLATALTVSAAPKSEDELIAELASPSADKVAVALQQLEKAYPTSTKAHPQIKKLLSDDRPKVRRKAEGAAGRAADHSHPQGNWPPPKCYSRCLPDAGRAG
jgi:hypothetical protein